MINKYESYYIAAIYIIPVMKARTDHPAQI